MNVTQVLASYWLPLSMDIIAMCGAISLYYWVNSNMAAPFAVAHKRGLSLLVGVGFTALLFCRLLVGAVPAWSGLNLLIVTMFLLCLQLRRWWLALLDTLILAGYYWFLSQPTLRGVAAVLVAGGLLFATQAYAAQLVAKRFARYGLFALVAAAVLVMQAELMPNAGWRRELPALVLLAWVSLALDQAERQTLRRTRHIQTMTTIDELTGVRNFGTFNQALDKHFDAFQKSGTPYAVFEGDLDHFKHINDTYGHPDGNVVLQRLALELDAFADSLPFPATAYRLGGEEFAIIAETRLSHAQAMAIGERFQTLLKLVRFPEVDPALRITCSIGQARVQAGDYSANDVYDQADHNLYDAKRNGRNQVKAQAD